MTALDVDTVGDEDLRESGQTVDGRSREDRALVEELLEEFIEDMRRLLPQTQLPHEESRLRVPDQVLAVLLPADAEGFAVEDEDAARDAWIHEVHAL